MCRRQTYIGLGYCKDHIKSAMHLTIKQSSIPGAGKGVFVWGQAFQAGQVITPYDGEVITTTELTRRYGVYTAPYSCRLGDTHNEDGALHRGIGTIINHGTGARVNADLVLDPTNRVIVVARRTIPVGREVLVSYGPGYQFGDGCTWTTKA
jgi:hypothetical protein